MSSHDEARRVIPEDVWVALRDEIEEFVRDFPDERSGWAANEIILSFNDLLRDRGLTVTVSSHDEASSRDQAIETIERTMGIYGSPARRAVDALAAAGLLRERDEPAPEHVADAMSIANDVLRRAQRDGKGVFSVAAESARLGVVAGREQASRDTKALARYRAEAPAYLRRLIDGEQARPEQEEA